MRFDQPALGLEADLHDRRSQGLQPTGTVLARQIDLRSGLAVAVGDPINSPVGLVPQRSLIGVALAVLEPVGHGVVLDDKVVPIEHP